MLHVKEKQPLDSIGLSETHSGNKTVRKERRIQYLLGVVPERQREKESFVEKQKEKRESEKEVENRQ